MTELCGSAKKSTNMAFGKKSEDLRKSALLFLRWHNTHAHIHGQGRVSEKTDGNKIDAGLGVGADIFQTNSARAFQGNAAFKLGATLDRAPHVFGRHVIEQ